MHPQKSPVLRPHRPLFSDMCSAAKRVGVSSRGVASMQAALLCVWVLVGCAEPAGDGPRGGGRAAMPEPVLASTVGAQDLSRSITLSNPIEAIRVVDLAARTNGVVTEVLVEEGDPIKVGDVLARIDVAEQRAELARAQAQLQEREANFERFQQLKDRDYIDAASFEAARAELAIARSDVALWQTRVDFGEVTSTVNGTVIDRMIEPGEAIASNGVLFSIADLSTLVVRLGVSELDVGQLQVGQDVSVIIDALDRNQTQIGQIRRIFPAADPTSRLITVEVALPKTEAANIKPGFLARVELVVESFEDVIAIPAIAAGQRDGQAYVMVIDEDMTLSARPVELGVSRGVMREVISGLEVGERVVPSNPSELNAGDLVRIVEWDQDAT